jgi:hypothetical protein
MRRVARKQIKMAEALNTGQFDALAPSAKAKKTKSKGQFVIVLAVISFFFLSPSKYYSVPR